MPLQRKCVHRRLKLESAFGRAHRRRRAFILESLPEKFALYTHVRRIVGRRGLQRRLPGPADSERLSGDDLRGRGVLKHFHAGQRLSPFLRSVSFGLPRMLQFA
jgi:hypothetical protein